MKSWQEKTLSDLGKVARGKSRHRPRNADFLYGGEYPFIQTSDIKHANFRIKEYTQTYSEEGLKQSKLWKKDTLCITIAANIADTAILGIDACFPDSIMGFVPYENVSDVRFVKYCFDILQKKIQQISQGAAQDNLSLEKLLTVKFLVPDYPTQRKIATILSSYDDLIENNLKRIKLLEESLQLVFSFLSNNPKITSENVYPTYADFLKGSEPGSNSYSETNSECKLPFIRVGDLGARNSNIYIEANIKGIKIANKQDILISMDATIGVVKIGMAGAYSSGIRKVVPTNEIYKGYLYGFLKSKNGQDQIMTYAKGSTILHASSAIPKLKVRIPNISKSKDELNGLNKMLNLIINLSEQNEFLKESRDILLPRLMSGVIEVG